LGVFSDAHYHPCAFAIVRARDRLHPCGGISHMPRAGIFISEKIFTAHRIFGHARSLMRPKLNESAPSDSRPPPIRDQDRSLIAINFRRERFGARLARDALDYFRCRARIRTE
jgi:hypothetical protein